MNSVHICHTPFYVPTSAVRASRNTCVSVQPRVWANQVETLSGHRSAATQREVRRVYTTDKQVSSESCILKSTMFFAPLHHNPFITLFNTHTLFLTEL